jgi:hypothetical protein
MALDMGEALGNSADLRPAGGRAQRSGESTGIPEGYATEPYGAHPPGRTHRYRGSGGPDGGKAAEAERRKKPINRQPPSFPPGPRQKNCSAWWKA